MTAKIQIIMQAKADKVPVISSMGAGNKLNPQDFEVSDIYKTSVCPLAKVMRKELKARGVKRFEGGILKGESKDAYDDYGGGQKAPSAWKCGLCPTGSGADHRL